MRLMSEIVSYYNCDGNILDSLHVNDGEASLISSYNADGKIKQCIHPDSVFNFGYVNDSPSLNFGTGDFSISAWVRSNRAAINYESGLVTKTANFQITPGFFIEVSGYGGDFTNYGIICGLTNGSFGGALAGSSGFYTNNTWTHVVFTRQGNIGTCYANGVANVVTHPDFSANVNNTEPMQFGKHSWGSFLNSDIDEVGIWKVALDISEVQFLYNLGAGRSYPFSSKANFLPFFNR